MSNEPQILCVGPLGSKKIYHALHRELLEYVLKDKVYSTVDTAELSNVTLDIDKIVRENFNDTSSVIVLFTAGSWIGNTNVRIKNHEKYYKLYDICDQKIDKQYNVILKPNKFNGYFYKHKSAEMDQLIEWTDKLGMDHYHWPFYTDSTIFKNYKLPKIYDILFSGTISHNYPFRTRLYNLLLDNKGKFNIKFLSSKQVGQPAIAREDYSKMLNQSWLSVSTAVGHHDRFVTKYQEIPFSSSCILGDLPSRYRKFFEDKVVEITNNMSDKKIISKIESALNNKEDLLRRTAYLHEKFIKLFSFEQGKKDFDEIIDRIVRSL